jgi:hypothetical protein
MVYPVRYTLTNPHWCTGAVVSRGNIYVPPGLNYATATVEAFGDGVALRGPFFLDQSHYGAYVARYRRLLPEIGRSGITKRIVTSSLLSLHRDGQPVNTGCI